MRDGLEQGDSGGGLFAWILGQAMGCHGKWDGEMGRSHIRKGESEASRRVKTLDPRGGYEKGWGDGLVVYFRGQVTGNRNQFINSSCLEREMQSE